MEGKSRFHRSFLIFENEDSGYEAGQKPSGYLKIEVREGKGRLWLSAQNLRRQGERYVYELHLIKAAGAAFAMASAGMLAAGNNGYSLEWEFNPSNVAGSGIRAEDIDTAVILVRFADRENRSIVCPLAAYKKGETEWRKKAAERSTLKSGNGGTGADGGTIRGFWLLDSGFWAQKPGLAVVGAEQHCCKVSATVLFGSCNSVVFFGRAAAGGRVAGEGGVV
jgi:hypothetical protein